MLCLHSDSHYHAALSSVSGVRASAQSDAAELRRSSSAQHHVSSSSGSNGASAAHKETKKAAAAANDATAGLNTIPPQLATTLNHIVGQVCPSAAAFFDGFID